MIGYYVQIQIEDSLRKGKRAGYHYVGQSLVMLKAKYCPTRMFFIDYPAEEHNIFSVIMYGYSLFVASRNLSPLSVVI